MLEGEHPPIEVLITRGESAGNQDIAHQDTQHVESRHICHAVLCNSVGEVVASFGEKNFSTFPRSSLKMIQAVAFGESDAVSRFNLDDECAAIACGSHSGEEKHVEKIRQWLAKIGLNEKNLECGSHPPLDRNSANALVARSENHLPAHHMCSGKHCAMLSLARAKNWQVEGYCEHQHPVQQRVTEVCSRFFDYDLQQAPRGRDGCSIPTFAVPLQVLAKGMARFSQPSSINSLANEKRTAVAAARMFQAMVEKPFFVAGSKQADTVMIEKGRGKFAVKSGAEGVYTATIPSLKLGIAVKCVDGTTRAAKATIAQLLQKLNLLTSEDADNFANKTLTNFRGFIVGAIKTRIV